ncbi:hypothetical protein AB205_0053710, partial [Aquarana catesbeiana]
GSSNGNPPERCPRPLYSRDSTQEGHTIPHHHQGEDLMNMKVEGEVEETYVRDDQQYTEEAGMTRTFIEEDTSTEISTGQAMEKPSKDCPILWRIRDQDITGDCGGEKTMISTMDGGLHSVDRPWNPSDSEQPRTVRDGAGIQGEETFSCPECGGSFSSEFSLSFHQRSHTGVNLHSCPDVDGPSYSSYPEEPQTVRDGAVLPTEKRFSCTECGKSFHFKFNLDEHKRSHTNKKPHSCPECGKCFLRKFHLSTHQKSHAVQKPFSCPECGKYFVLKLQLDAHQLSHMEKKSYSCPECGKCFSLKSSLRRHQKLHTGEKPYSCSECGKCFSRKLELVAHQRCHTGENPYSCPAPHSVDGPSYSSYPEEPQTVRDGAVLPTDKRFSCTECG